MKTQWKINRKIKSKTWDLFEMFIKIKIFSQSNWGKKEEIFTYGRCAKILFIS